MLITPFIIFAVLPGKIFSTALTPPSTEVSALEVVGPELVARALDERANPQWAQFRKGAIALWAASADQDATVWANLVSNCAQSGHNAAAAAICIASILRQTYQLYLLTGKYYDQGGTTSVVNDSPVKRDWDALPEWAANWDDLHHKHRAALREDFSPDGLYLHSVHDGHDSIPGSMSVHYASDNSSIPHLSHVTNGTHGMIHGLAGNTTSKRDTFSMGHMKGVKLNYFNPCSAQGISTAAAANTDDINDALSQFATYSTTFMSNTYEMEMASNGRSFGLFTLVAELNSFGSNYEKPPFDGPAAC